MENKLTVEGIKSAFEYLNEIDGVCASIIKELGNSGYLEFNRCSFESVSGYDKDKFSITYSDLCYDIYDESSIIVSTEDLVNVNEFIKKFKEKVDIEREESKKRNESYKRDMELKQLEILKNKYENQQSK